MKDSYLRSKVELKPLDKGDFGTKNQMLDYEQYEQQLNNYSNDKKQEVTDLFDWSKPSQIIGVKQPAPLLPNNSMNTEELLRSEEGDRHEEGQGNIHGELEDSDLDGSIDLQSPRRSRLSPEPSFAEQVRTDYGSEYRLMSSIKLESQLREMRDKIITMNSRLNKKLDKYEILQGELYKKQVNMGNPHKLTARQIELNSRIIEKQQAQIKSIEDKDKELDQKDFLIELNQLIIEIKKQIHDIEKEKHDDIVDLQKIDKLLKEFEHVQAIGDQYKEVKDLKHLIVFYFKKMKDQKATEEQLQTDHQVLLQKEEAMAARLADLSRVAAQQYLEVSTNKPYVEMKRRHDELTAIADSHIKKRDSTLRIQRGHEEKLEKEMQNLKHDIKLKQEDIQEVELLSLSVDQETNQFMTKNNVLSKQYRSISYKFDESLIRTDKAKFKPDFRRKAASVMGSKVNQTIDVDSRHNDERTSNFNDKNMPQEIAESIQNGSSETLSAISRMKPILRNWKGKGNSARYPGSPEKAVLNEGSNIFKPSLLSKSRKR